MNEFKDLTDFEITDRLARILLRGQIITFKPKVEDSIDKLLGIKQHHLDIVTSSGSEQRLDFCHDASRVWNLVVKYRVNVSFSTTCEHYSEAVIKDANGNPEFCSDDRNTLRAVAICCIMKLEAKHGKA